MLREPEEDVCLPWGALRDVGLVGLTQNMLAAVLLQDDL